MNCRNLCPDILSNLPYSVIDEILLRLPSRDAMRTSVLSKKWRYHWCRLTALTLDRSLWVTRKDLLHPEVKFTKIFYQIFSLHEGPITRFTLNISSLKKCPNIDNLIYFLSRNGIQRLALCLSWYGKYRLPSSLFTCSQLRVLTLEDCSISPPSDFIGFDWLISLELREVIISSESLKNLISHCPLLERLVFGFSESDSVSSDIIEINAPKLRFFDFSGCINFVSFKNVPQLDKVSLVLVGEHDKYVMDKFFLSLPALGYLDLHLGSLEPFVAEAPRSLSSTLNCIKHLSVSLTQLDGLSCVLCVVRSSPYLQNLEVKVELGDVDKLDIDCVNAYRSLLKFDPSVCFSDVSLNHLKTIKVGGISDTTFCMQLIKLLLAKSPVLVRMLIKGGSEFRAAVETFPRASRIAEVVYQDGTLSYWDFNLKVI